MRTVRSHLGALLLLFLTTSTPAATGLEGDLDAAAAQGLLRSSGGTILAVTDGRYPLEVRDLEVEGEEVALVFWSSYPRGEEVACELWVPAAHGDFARAHPGAGREHLWAFPAYRVDEEAATLEVERALLGENGRTPDVFTREVYSLTLDGLVLLQKTVPDASSVDALMNIAFDLLVVGRVAEGAAALGRLPEGDVDVLHRAEDLAARAAAFHGIPVAPLPPGWVEVRAVLARLRMAAGVGSGTGDGEAPGRAAVASGSWLGSPASPAAPAVAPAPAPAEIPPVPADPADLDGATAHALLRGLGFYRPVVTISLKRKYKSYVQAGPRPDGIPADEFPLYQMALLALAQGNGGPDQSKLSQNRSRYFSKGKAFDLDAKVYDWWKQPKYALREALVTEAAMRAAALAEYPDVSELGRVATPEVYAALVEQAADDLESDRVGLPWGTGHRMRLMDSLMWQESRRVQWRERYTTVSNAGAIGMGQLMPFNRSYHPDLNEYDPLDNVRALASDMTRWIQEAKSPRTPASRKASRLFPQTPMGRLRFALAMYNGGYATTKFSREHYAENILKMFEEGGPPDPIHYP